MIYRVITNRSVIPRHIISKIYIKTRKQMENFSDTACGSNSNAEAVLSNWDGHIKVENSNNAAFALRSAGAVAQDSNPICESGNGTQDVDSSLEIINIGEEHALTQTGKEYYRKDKLRTNRSGTSRDGVLKPIHKHILHNSLPNCTTYGSADATGISQDVGIYGESRHSFPQSGFTTRQMTLGSSLLADSMTEIVADELINEYEPTSAVLDYCKRKFLRPYVRILSLIGLNPIATDTTSCRSCFSYLQAIIVLLALIFGYILQYLCSYRGDRGFANYRKIFPRTFKAEDEYHKEDSHTIGEFLFGYIVPNLLHLCGFVSAVIVWKMMDQEQLQNLIERVFLMSMKPRHLCRVLWIYVLCGFLMLCLLFAYVTPSVLMQTQIIHIKWLKEVFLQWQLTVKIILLISLFIQNLAEIIILSSYCIQCYLLRTYLNTLSHKLLMHSIESLDWMREILEFHKLLDHLNHRIALPVCFFIIMNLAYAFAGFVYLFNDFDFHYSALKVVILNIFNILLWLTMGLVPFFMAASVTRVCQAAKANGHQVRVRPFVYHNTSSDDLNSTLLFASSLDMSAKLFRMPIQPNYLCFAILVVSVIIITLGMCLNLSALGSL